MLGADYWRPIWRHKGATEQTDRELAGRSVYTIFQQGALVNDAIIGLELHPYESLLDVGCAAGFTGHILAKRCTGYVGLDYSQAALDMFRAKYNPNGKLVCSSAMDMPFPDQSFDKAYMGSVLLCMSKDEGFRALKEMRRVTRARAYVADTLMDVKTPECAFPDKPGCACNAHVTSYEPGEFIEMAGRAGWLESHLVPMHWCLPHFYFASDCILA